jgi:hypothetical protein
MAASFSIRLDPSDSSRGEIRVGPFCESFDLEPCCWSGSEYQSSWTRSLRRLVASSHGSVALFTWRHKSDVCGAQRAWVLFRLGSEVFIQERIFVPGEHRVGFDADDQAVDLAPRETRSDNGHPISEWQTSIDAILAFMRDDGAI